MREPLEALIERCRGREEDAMSELVSRFRAWALDLAAALVSDVSLAEDVVQEAFTTALLRLPELRDPLAFAGWLRQIVRTHANHLMRKRREVPLAEEDSPACGSSSSADLERNELREYVREVVRGLPRAMRDTTELFYLEERSCAEISAMLDVPQGTVKRRLHDARERLRDTLAGTLDADMERKNLRHGL